MQMFNIFTFFLSKAMVLHVRMEKYNNSIRNYVCTVHYILKRGQIVVTFTNCTCARLIQIKIYLLQTSIKYLHYFKVWTKSFVWGEISSIFNWMNELRPSFLYWNCLLSLTTLKDCMFYNSLYKWNWCFFFNQYNLVIIYSKNH